MSVTDSQYLDDLYAKIEVLARRLWAERRIQRREVDSWLDNFGPSGTADKERLHALYLLSRSMFFPNPELREVIRALYRDHLRYPIIRELRIANGDTTDAALLEQLFRTRLEHMRFLGIGNPSESGAHLLYFFRQENRLPTRLFLDSHQLFEVGSQRAQLRSPDVSDYVVLDDFCGSGDTAVDFSREVVADVRSAASTPVTIRCWSLFATQDGLEEVKAHGDFDEVNSVFVLDRTYRCFGEQSMYFPVPDRPVDKDFAREMCRQNGERLAPGDPFGYKDGQLLLAFSHNTPDNSLPVLWYDDPPPPWDPIFRRYAKVW